MMNHKIFSVLILVSLVLFGVKAANQQQSVIGDLGTEKLRRQGMIGQNINPISFWDRGDPIAWEMAAARGEQSEDCLLYGICTDDDDRGEDRGNS